MVYFAKHSNVLDNLYSHNPLPLQSTFCDSHKFLDRWDWTHSKYLFLIQPVLILLNSAVENTKLKETNSIAYRVVGAATKKSIGIKKGEIIIAEEVEKTIRLVIQQSQKMAASIIYDVVVTFSGGSPISKNLYQDYTLR